MKKPGTTTRRNGTIRCAMYTRKSSEEGLEQEFNSLQAQREACEAFINSQRHEGWVCLPAAFDDGGLSGATMGRPALPPHLPDITPGRIGTVVVYKIDRLARSLADFAKIVEILDAKGASLSPLWSLCFEPVATINTEYLPVNVQFQGEFGPFA